jgi:hypothetical protein
VALPPGCPRLLTNPAPTGSAETAITIGILLVACLAAWVGGVSTVTMTSTLRPTSSAASARRRSTCPSASRYSMLMLFPSIHPRSRTLSEPLFELRQRHRSCVLRNLFGAHFRLPAGRTRFATRRAQWQAQIPVCGACSYDFRPGSTANHNAYYRTLPRSPRRFE